LTAVSRVLVNLCWLVPGVVGGSEESVTDALRAVADDLPDDLELRLAVLETFPTAHPDLAERFDTSVLRHDGSNKARRVAAEHTWLVREARRWGAGVVHHAGGVVPLVHPGRVVLTIQDLQPLDLPQNFSPRKRAYIRAMVGRSARSAAVVHVPSSFTRDRVTALLRVPPERVRVVPWFPRPSPPADQEAAAASTLGVPRRFVLYPAITYPHKNHLVLLEAFSRLLSSDPDVRLVLTGGEGPSEPAVQRRLAAPDLRGRVLRTGRVPTGVLEELYRRAAVVVVPSRYEGFGLPVLEAMQRGCPVIASSAGSLPEVSSSAEVVDPGDVTAWSRAMQSVLAMTPAERSARVADGFRLAGRFTPAATAGGLIDVYRCAAHGS
jgi:glycosyltransferase involved in cell wall biosynthesis